MQTRPEKWTKHHTHRVLHVSGFVTTLMVLIMLCWVFGTNLAKIKAQDTITNDRVRVTVPGVVEGPSTVEGEENFGSSSAPASYKGLQNPIVTILPVIKPGTDYYRQTIKVDGYDETQYVFSTQYLTFSGHTNIRNASIHLEIDSKLHITGNVFANSSGDWTWDPGQPISVEEHILTVTATDPASSQIRSQAKFYFKIVLNKGQTEIKPTVNNTPEKGNGGNLFDVVLAIPTQFKTIATGGELLAKVKFVNFGSAGKPVDVGAEYTIRNSKGDIISESSETIAVATQISILKTFYVNPEIPPGMYTLNVSIPSKDLVATATDTFEIKSKDEIAGTNQPPINYNIVFQIISAMVLLAALILYLEYNKVEMISSVIKQLSEKDLIKI